MLECRLAGSPGSLAGRAVRGRTKSWAEAVELRLVYHVLLVFLACMFLFQPLLAQSGFLMNMCYAVIPITATVAVFQQRRLFLAGMVLAFLAGALRLIGLEDARALALGLSLASYVFSIVIFLRGILSHHIVTAETISGSLCVYLMFGMVWTLAYILLETVSPGSFEGLVPAEDVGHQLFYYSFVTLTTLGFGDIIPATDPARSLTTVQALTGQLYLIAMVARLVGLQVAKEGMDRHSAGSGR